MIKRMILIILTILLLSTTTYASNWKINIFGFDPDIVNKQNWKEFVLGIVVNNIIHVGSHYLYAWANNMSVHQDGIDEVVAAGYSNKQYREFAQAGFITEDLGGLIITSIPSLRNTGFTKGYVSTSFAKLITYPLIYQHEGDFKMSSKFGGNGDIEYFGHIAVTIYNISKINWKKGE